MGDADEDIDNCAPRDEPSDGALVYFYEARPADQAYPNAPNRNTQNPLNEGGRVVGSQEPRRLLTRRGNTGTAGLQPLAAAQA
eukprot:414323-Heterocapsa_arctica.AAC.1